MRKCALCPHEPSRELDPISAMSWGVEPVRRDQQANRLFEWKAFCTPLPKIASKSGRHDKTLIKQRRPDQPSRLICSSVTTLSTFSVFLLMRNGGRPSPSIGRH